MNADQFSRYLSHLDHPIQLTLEPNVTSLYMLYQEHMTRFAYSNIDLYMGAPVADLSVDSLLNELPVRGGHCIQHGELMYAALVHLGFNVTRVAGRVLMGSEYKEGMALDHSFLLVKIDGAGTYMCDPGLASATPRFPVKLDMTVTEEVTVNRGEDYKLEVGDDHYNFYWRLKGEWLLLFRFGRDKTTGSPIKSDHKTALQLCQEVYTVPDYIPIRDKYVKVSSQTNDSKIDFFFMEGQYSYKVFNKSQLVEAKTGLDYKTFFQLLNKMCKMDVQPIELPSK